VKTRFNPFDHAILLSLIRGNNMSETAKLLGISVGQLGNRIKRMNALTQCNTTYQLVALEMVNLLGSDKTDEQIDQILVDACPPKAAAAFPD